jgi:hypothetical protein
VGEPQGESLGRLGEGAEDGKDVNKVGYEEGESGETIGKEKGA